MKLKLNEKWSCGTNGHCDNLQKVPVQNKTKTVKVFDKVKCLCYMGSLKCTVLMFLMLEIFSKKSLKTKNLMEKILFQTFKKKSNLLQKFAGKIWSNAFFKIEIFSNPDSLLLLILEIMF